MDMIKEAFSKIKEDILFLKNEIVQIKKELLNINKNNQELVKTEDITNLFNKTDKSDTYDYNNKLLIKKRPIGALYPKKSNISTGNNGVPTDRQTHQQTNRQIEVFTNDKFHEARRLIESLDNIKQDILFNFKQLTNQEMMVFSTLYLLEDKGFTNITYKSIAEELKLSESSIRDYITKLIQKGISIVKTKINNKKIILSISSDIRRITNLSTITRLREL